MEASQAENEKCCSNWSNDRPGAIDGNLLNQQRLTITPGHIVISVDKRIGNLVMKESLGGQSRESDKAYKDAKKDREVEENARTQGLV